MSTFNPPLRAKFDRNAALVSSAGTTMFMVVLVVLHVLRPDLDPSWHFISEYELGPRGWLMHVAFISLAVGTGSIALAIDLASPEHRRLPRNRTAPDQRRWNDYGRNRCPGLQPVGLHDIGAMLDLVPLAALLLAWSLSRNETQVSTSVSLWAVALLRCSEWLVFMVSMAIMLPRNGGRPGPSVVVGWQNLFMIITQCIWLLHTASHVSRKSAAK